MTFAISYKADMQQVMDVLMDLARKNASVLSDPAPVIHVTACAENGVNYVVRVWCKNTDYWDINFYLLEEGKKALDRAGIEIPYPQMDVHLK